MARVGIASRGNTTKADERASDVDDLARLKREMSQRWLTAGKIPRAAAGRHMLRLSAAVEGARVNVHAVGIGRKAVATGKTLERCVVFYVVEKLPKTLVPPRDRIPKAIDGFPTDVVESPRARFHAARTGVLAKASAPCTVARKQRQRPLVAGISVGHYAITAGTIACFCRFADDDSDDVLILSNNHVLADVNRGSSGDAVLQPGPIDGGRNGDRVAELTKFVRIQTKKGTRNRVDAAVAKLRRSTFAASEICTIGALRGSACAEEEMEVVKHGRTTGYAEGRVTETLHDAEVDLGDGRIAVFEDQLRIEPVSPYTAIGLGGDSGSLVVAKSGKKAVGLYFAGPESGEYGLANPIDDVLKALGIRLL